MTRKLATITVVASLLAGCADGSVLVTGAKRAPMSPSVVTVYLQPPSEPFDVIGLVKAQSDAGMTQQGSVDYATQELKRQAASVGANGVILSNAQTKSSSSYGMLSGGSFFMYSIETEALAGQAIYVKK